MAAGSIGPIVTTAVTNVERRFGVRLIPDPKLKARGTVSGPWATELGAEKKSASGGLDAVFGLPNFFVVERRKGSTTVKGAPALPGAA